MSNAIFIPKKLLPSDGRFGAGPSLIRKGNVSKLVSSTLLGTSHRSKPVKDKVAKISAQLRALLEIPSDYLVIFGNGGATTFWSVATCSLAKTQVAHACFGSFGKKFFSETSRAPFLAPSIISEAEAGALATLPTVAGSYDPDETTYVGLDDIANCDLYAYPHHETSTGVISSLYQVKTSEEDQGLTVVDATSIAGAVKVDWSAVDVYYFSPQKCFAADGGLWIAIMSPRAVERAKEVSADTSGGRWVPDILNLDKAIQNSVKDQTLNTPAIATLELFDAQLEWMLDNGGIEFSEQRSKTSSRFLYDWAEKTSWAAPFVQREQWRSPVVVTIDIKGFDAAELIAIMRANGVVDISPYRSLGRNQIRVATFPSVDPEDAQRLTQSLQYVGDRLIEKS